MKKTICFLTLVLCSLGFAGSNEPTHQPLPTLNLPLKPREPNWRTEIVQQFPNGIPQTILFYQPLPNEKEIPVKQVMFHDNGKILSETDIAVVDEDSEAATMWKSKLVPHGVRIELNREGKLVKAANYQFGFLEGECRMLYPNAVPLLSQHFVHGKLEGKVQSFYEDGKLKEEASYHNGVLDGYFAKYNETGSKIASVFYKEGKPDGLAQEWFPSGVLLSQRHFINGELHGDGKNPAFIVYDEDKNIREVIDFRDGVPYGTQRQYHPNGKESYQVQFKNGLKEGKEFYYSDKGIVIGEGVFKGGKAVGKHWREHTNGSLAYLAEYNSSGKLLEPIVEMNDRGEKIRQYTLVDGVLEGYSEEWFSNGAVKGEFNYVQGKYDGEQKEYYPSGQIKVRSHFVNEKRNGLHEEWDENGVLSRKINFFDGKKEGPTIEWYPNGSSKLDAYYQEDLPEGVQSEWHENGQLKMRAEFASGLKEGWHREWNENGELVFEAHYDQDALDGTLMTWWNKDQLRTKFHFVKGKKEGKHEWFYENGGLERVIHFQDDVNSGDLLAWYPDGSIQSKQRFEKGKPVGDHKDYYPKSNPDQKDVERLARFFNYDDEGRLQGEAKTFYPNGKLQGLLCHEHGVLHGIKKMYDENGNALEEANYISGKLEGRFFQKLEDGKEIVYTYRKNLKNGPHEIFFPPNEKGEKIKSLEAHYESDQINGLVVEYNQEGLKTAESTYLNGLREGPATLYGANGKINTMIQFSKNEKNGLAIQYYPSGSVFRETFFIGDKREGIT
jgi:antitoxin component YwqK of YwqJK toxin-antitoxin module